MQQNLTHQGTIAWDLCEPHLSRRPNAYPPIIFTINGRNLLLRLPQL